MTRRMIAALGVVLAAAGLAYLLTDPPQRELEVVADDDLWECVTCGVPALLVDGKFVNPGPGDAPTFCIPLGTVTRPNRRIHGPFVPVIHVS